MKPHWQMPAGCDAWANEWLYGAAMRLSAVWLNPSRRGPTCGMGAAVGARTGATCKHGC